MLELLEYVVPHIVRHCSWCRPWSSECCARVRQEDDGVVEVVDGLAKLPDLCVVAADEVLALLVELARHFVLWLISLSSSVPHKWRRCVGDIPLDAERRVK